MPLTVVDITGLNDKMQPEVVGHVAWDGAKFIINPPDTGMKTVLEAQVLDVKNERWIKATDDPMAWLALLQYHYKSAYRWASAPRQA